MFPSKIDGNLFIYGTNLKYWPLLIDGCFFFIVFLFLILFTLLFNSTATILLEGLHKGGRGVSFILYKSVSALAKPQVWLDL